MRTLDQEDKYLNILKLEKKLIFLFQPSATAGKRKKRSTVEAVEEVIN